MDLSRFERVRLAHLPTPIEPMERLTRELGGARLFVKRDDATGVALGGNKTRKLEFQLAEALAAGADTVVTAGAIQSNHARQAAAAAARLGLDCVVILRWNIRPPGTSFSLSGNILLDRLLGAEIRTVAADETPDQAAQRTMEDLSRRGRNPFFIPAGGANATGSLGYAAAAAEIVDQARALNVRFDRIVVASSSGGTQAGLLAGLHALDEPIPVLGVGVAVSQAEQEAKVWSLTEATANLIGADHRPDRGHVVVDCGHHAGHYGVVKDSTLDALKLVGRMEGLALDPVYSGVAMVALIEAVRSGSISAAETVLFLHTGGSAGLFGYADRLAADFPPVSDKSAAAS